MAEEDPEVRSLITLELSRSEAIKVGLVLRGKVPEVYQRLREAYRVTLALDKHLFPKQEVVHKRCVELIEHGDVVRRVTFDE